MSTSGAESDGVQQLAITATLGTERAGGKLPPAALLTEAAWALTRQRAGCRTTPVTATLPICPQETKPTATPTATALLHRLLASPDAGLINEWASLASSRGVRVPDQLVPDVLHWWANQPQRDSTLPRVLGVRGQWLMTLNEAWRKPVQTEAIPADSDNLWQTGTAAERQALLTTIRRQDPARALALIQGTWASDGADERKRWVQTLQHGLSMADEPFLEAVLDDRAKSVREAAAEVLADLPESRLRARMNERLRACIVSETKKSLLRRAKTDVSIKPPTEFIKEWVRDGLDETPTDKTGKRAWWLMQIIGRSDLRVWTESTGLDPTGVLEAVKEDDSFDNVLKALLTAAARAGDMTWASVLLETCLDREKIGLERISALLVNLKPEQREALLLKALPHKRLGIVERWTVLADAKHAWSPRFSTSVLKQLKQAKGQREQMWQLWEPIERVSRSIWPGAAEDFEAAAKAALGEELTDSIKTSLDRVRLRAEMHKEFAT